MRDFLALFFNDGGTDVSSTREFDAIPSISQEIFNFRKVIALDLDRIFFDGPPCPAHLFE